MQPQKTFLMLLLSIQRSSTPFLIPITFHTFLATSSVLPTQSPAPTPGFWATLAPLCPSELEERSLKFTTANTLFRSARIQWNYLLSTPGQSTLINNNNNNNSKPQKFCSHFHSTITKPGFTWSLGKLIKILNPRIFLYWSEKSPEMV